MTARQLKPIAATKNLDFMDQRNEHHKKLNREFYKHRRTPRTLPTLEQAPQMALEPAPQAAIVDTTPPSAAGVAAPSSPNDTIDTTPPTSAGNVNGATPSTAMALRPSAQLNNSSTVPSASTPPTDTWLTPWPR